MAPRKTAASGAPAGSTARTRPRQTLLGLWASVPPAKRKAARRAAYRAVFDTPQGRTVLADIMMSAGFLVARPPQDLAAANHGEGARWLVAEILAAAGVEGAALTMAVIHDDLSLATE